MPELVTIPISIFDFTVDYERPEFQLLADRAGIVQAIFDGLKPWNPSVDDIEFLNTGKTSEQGTNLRLPMKRVSFFIGPSYFRFSKEAADWHSAQETIEILDHVLSALLRLSGVKVATKKTSLSMHLQPRRLTFIDILRPFIAPPLAALESDPLITLAAVAKWNNRKVTVDGSAAVANGVFVRLDRDFPAASTYEDIIQQLKTDQANIFELLGVEEDQG